MNINSSRDKGKAIITPRRDVEGSIGVPQCSNGSQDDTHVTTNTIIAIIVSDKNHAELSAKPIQSSNKFESLNFEGGEIIVDLSPAPGTNSGYVAIFKRQVMEVESMGHKLESPVHGGLLSSLFLCVRFLALAMGCSMLVATAVVIACMIQASFGVAEIVPVL
ncbi:unnamed protein product [Ilex paraguariensis]|uniref:Uncharacterized protein n=1 Tax=Ilex paraguariensis TaxID=185542 RepID=A0ABC8TYD1_9AQUA